VPAVIDLRNIIDDLSTSGVLPPEGGIDTAATRDLDACLELAITSVRSAAAVVAQQSAAAAYRQSTSRERRQLGRDLHDTVSNTLWSLALLTEMALGSADLTSRDRALIEKIDGLASIAREETRSLMQHVQLPTESIVDLAERLTPIVARCSALSDLTIRALLQPTFITVEHSLTLCRIAREALNNVGRHSDASVVDVRLVAEPAVTLSIHDNGTGFDPTMVTSDHYGLSIMQERSAEINADFSIDSSPGKGTTITVSLAE
jgi:signal transduction histidine kinase